MIDSLRKISLGLIGIVLVTIGSGCEKPGLAKTPLIIRERKSFPSVGFSMEIPKQPPQNRGSYNLDIHDKSEYCSGFKVKGGVTLSLHPFYQPDEPIYLLIFSVFRFSPEQFEMLLNKQHPRLTGSVPFGSFRDDPLPFQSSVSEMRRLCDANGTQWLCFRRDLKLANGDILVAGARLMEYWRGRPENVIPDNEEDIKAMKEMLNSIRPLEN